MLTATDHKIKLGIDAKWFFKGPPSGNMVVKNLVNEMVNNTQERFEIYLLITSDFKQQAIEHFPATVKLVFLPVVPNLLSNLLLIPYFARLHKLEIVLFQNFNSLWPNGFRKVVYIHDVLFLDFPQYYSSTELLYFKQMKNLAKKADMIITISNTEKERLVKNDIANGKNISVVYHGINSNFKVLAAYSKAKIQSIVFKYQLPQRYLLYVGRVNIRKNISRLVSAINLLDDKNIKLLIVGGQGNDLTALQNQIMLEGLSKRVVFTGHVPEEDLYVIYANATVFCFPSHAEGFGLPPLEAMQCGVPVIVSNRTSMPEICGDAAIYIDPDNTEDVAQKINLLLNDNELYQRKVTAGIDHSKQFSWPGSANGILKLISDAYIN
ncbi:Glycosyltransferase involved in cell wall bisynthesis [Mucilaginibacter pineti]|uniref:Glycosyltransferase involved in cell wall bisynthesis n=1 Tax=Mucilaginibacter pineti TaxID=1391627 RepID=A0A1G6UE89_9SPHI|nr:glycosyltransferase family 1 protein [Mucilaginibacter pineti]SDD39712.1 Glycosyltransferase involved in cell wall bisynthesis [Mucilaginibacter pineti]